jgi:hypothetical protein
MHVNHKITKGLSCFLWAEVVPKRGGGRREKKAERHQTKKKISNKKMRELPL